MSVKERLIGLLDYVEELARLPERAVFSVRSYRTMMFFEHQLRGRIGIRHNVADEQDVIWLRIERVHRKAPPFPSEDIGKWLTVSNDPNNRPEVHETIMEAMSHAAAERLVEEGAIDEEDVMGPCRGDASAVDVRLRIDRRPDAQEMVGDYIAGPWQDWAEEEKLRRETIAIYDKLFSVAQLIETGGADNPTEAVLGVGMALWRTEGKKIEHPLVEALVEISIDPETHAIHVQPREAAPQVYLKPFDELGNPGVSDLKAAAQTHFKGLAEATGTDGVSSAGEFSPYNRRSWEPILRDAVRLLSPGAVYYPDIAEDPSDRSLPEITEHLSITDTWALYARPRSGNLYVQDVKRLREEVESTEEAKLPATGKRLVTPPTDEPFQPTGLDLNQANFSG